MEKSKVYTSKVSPFVKWAGGKHQLLPIIREKIPKKFNNYIEPFVGGGALVFDLLPVHATINDINKALINTYRQIKNVPEDFLRAISLYDDKIIDGGKEYYYKMRELYNDKMMKSEYDVELAALFVFLNKHCFNGLYRVNSKGLFNVPYNNSIKKSCDPKNISEVSTQLKKINILEGDFQVVCETATKGDFVFIDSPYVPLKPSSFESYTKEGFDIE
ncbi:MAG: Dam family site-specific DNA-(adenine-N6)-methyltransferase, partial [Sphaerochaetaceae bacterium]|nr:Dam family site-specific DNA-(adenine-N6)-methyltransferase [Sphaerochaetaceae bacterium]